MACVADQVRLQPKAAPDDLLLDLGGAAEASRRRRPRTRSGNPQLACRAGPTLAVVQRVAHSGDHSPPVRSSFLAELTTWIVAICWRFEALTCDRG
jgi:hypothetical protein